VTPMMSTPQGLRLRLARAVTLAVVLVSPALGGIARAAQPQVKVEELTKALLEDQNYKVRVQAALVLGRLGDHVAVPALIKALEDPNKTVRAIAAQALGQLADHDAGDPLRALLKREGDPFVRTQTEKALALVSGEGANKKAKIYLNFGPFTGGVKSATADAAKILHDALSRELGKMQTVTLSLEPAEQKTFPKTGMVGFYIDGNITRLDDVPAGTSSETSCDVKVMVARWPSKSIILWTNAGASLQSGTRPQDKVSARKDCLEASAGQLAEDLGKFFKAQGG
jgi:HEAT repeats